MTPCGRNTIQLAAMLGAIPAFGSWLALELGTIIVFTPAGIPNAGWSFETLPLESPVSRQIALLGLGAIIALGSVCAGVAFFRSWIHSVHFRARQQVASAIRSS